MPPSPRSRRLVIICLTSSVQGACSPLPGAAAAVATAVSTSPSRIAVAHVFDGRKGPTLTVRSPGRLLTDDPPPPSLRSGASSPAARQGEAARRLLFSAPSPPNRTRAD